MLRTSTPEQPRQQTQHGAHHETRNDRKVEPDIFPFDDDVTGQKSAAVAAEEPKRRADRRDQQAENDEILPEDIHIRTVVVL
jgi:hypothetical protein